MISRLKSNNSVVLRGFRQSMACIASRALAVFFCVSPCCAATIRTRTDMRLWETVTDRTLPLSWPWDAAADSASLVFSNRLDKAVSSVDVVRGDGETRGVCSQPAPQAGDGLVDVTLVQKAGGNVVARESATLAYVSGAGGGPIAVRARDTHGWNRFMEPRVHAFDPVWLGETGESGYDIAWPEYVGFRIILR